ncbi:MAG: hypothetical protein ACYDCK_10040 [Thermoplasmatota archaeon]
MTDRRTIALAASALIALATIAPVVRGLAGPIPSMEELFPPHAPVILTLPPPTLPGVPSLPVPLPTLPPTIPTVPAVPAPSVPTIPTVPSPTVPTVPTIPTLPAPTIPTIPTLPTIPSAPTLPAPPSVPGIPTPPPTPPIPPTVSRCTHMDAAFVWAIICASSEGGPSGTVCVDREIDPVFDPDGCVQSLP